MLAFIGRFKEIAADNPLAALKYLQNDLYNIIDHMNKRETVEVRICILHLSDKQVESKLNTIVTLPILLPFFVVYYIYVVDIYFTICSFRS